MILDLYDTLEKIIQAQNNSPENTKKKNSNIVSAFRHKFGVSSARLSNWKKRGIPKQWKEHLKDYMIDDENYEIHFSLDESQEKKMEPVRFCRTRLHILCAYSGSNGILDLSKKLGLKRYQTIYYWISRGKIPTSSKYKLDNYLQMDSINFFKKKEEELLCL